MTEPTLQELRTELRRRADDVEVPPAPAFTALRTAHERRRRARIRRAAVLSAVAAAAVAAVFVVVISHDGPGQKRPHPPVAPSRTAFPPSLADLPRGEAPTTVAYVIGRTLHLGGHEMRLDGPPMNLLQAGSTVVIRSESGDIEVVDVEAGTTEHVVSAPEGNVTMDSAGKYLVWERSGADSGHPVIFVKEIGGGPEHQQTIPGNPSCCGDPFMLEGITTSGQVIGERGSDILVWDSERGSGADTVTKLRRVSTAVEDVSQIVGNEVILYDGHDYFPGSVPSGAFHLTDGRSYGADALSMDFGDPSALRFVSTIDPLRIYASERGPDPAGVHPVQLRLPPNAAPYQLRWEDPEHFVFEAIADNRPRYFSGALVRCEVTKGGCEIAQWLDRLSMLPQ